MGMVLQDTADGTGVEVGAFTAFEGEAGCVELSGQVKIGDRVLRVDGKSTHGKDYAGVIGMVITAPRPISFDFERSGDVSQDVARLEHWELDQMNPNLVSHGAAGEQAEGKGDGNGEGNGDEVPVEELTAEALAERVRGCGKARIVAE